MSDDTFVSEQVQHWQELRRQGQPATAEELCANRPELLDALKERLRAASLEGFLNGGGERDQALPTRPDAAAAAAAPSEAYHVAPTPDGYDVLEELGRGGMGVVYKARDLSLNRVVALKMILQGGRASPEQRARFRREAEVLAHLQHPHLVQIHAWGEHAGQAYFVLEFVAGGSLEKQLRHGRPAPHEAAQLVEVLARAVHYAHGQGVLHRDLKPGNVLLAPPVEGSSGNTVYGFPKIADFGLALHLESDQALTQSGNVMGTPAYMAPEQAAGTKQEVGPAADVWALGAILYELLTGRPPFRAKTVGATVWQLLHKTPSPPRTLRPEVPAELEAVCLACLDKSPAQRYLSAADLADALRRFLQAPMETSSAVAPPTRSRRLRWALALAGLLALGVLVWALAGLPREQGDPGTTASGASAPVSARGLLKGWIDAIVSEPNNPRRQLVRLYEPRARPLRVKDELRIEARLEDREAYLYVLWITPEGNVLPVYPWQEGDWAKRPTHEKPRRWLSLPEKVGDIYQNEAGPPGMATLVLLAMEQPLPAKLSLPRLLGNLGAQPLQDPLDVAWFEDGRLARPEATRTPNLKNPRPGSNGVLRTQQLLHDKLGPLGGHIWSVTFASLGS